MIVVILFHHFSPHPIEFQIEFHLVPILWFSDWFNIDRSSVCCVKLIGKALYNPNLFWIKKIPKRFPKIYWCAQYQHKRHAFSVWEITILAVSAEGAVTDCTCINIYKYLPVRIVYVDHLPVYWGWDAIIYYGWIYIYVYI